VSHPFDAVTESELRARRSAKWALYPPDVLPAWVAEMDYPVAEPIRRALHAAIDRHDLGYASAGGLAEAFARWAFARWGWAVDPANVSLVCDVMTGVAEILRVTTAPGDGVVLDPPVYPPFAGTIRQLGRVVVPAPLRRNAAGWALDLDRVEAAYAGGARVHLFCSPHNPTGLVHPRAALETLAALAARYGVLVVADEIHAPLTLPGAEHVPFPCVAPERCVVLTSASKAWNLAGLKAALIVGPRDVLDRLPRELPYHAGHLGVLGGTVAFDEGGPWLAETLAILDRNRALLADLVAAKLPHVRYVPPEAGYLAWLDFGAVLGPDPGLELLARGRVALSRGPTFGDEGAGFARLNFATTRTLLEEAVSRIARVT